MQCDSCGHEMTREPVTEFEKIAKIRIVGVEISVDEKFQWAIPRHKPGTYRICYSCWLEGLGVKPNLTLRQQIDLLKKLFAEQLDKKDHIKGKHPEEM